jgi:hypothetical protein
MASRQDNAEPGRVARAVSSSARASSACRSAVRPVLEEKPKQLRHADAEQDQANGGCSSRNAPQVLVVTGLSLASALRVAAFAWAWRRGLGA